LPEINTLAYYESLHIFNSLGSRREKIGKTIENLKLQQIKFYAFGHRPLFPNPETLMSLPWPSSTPSSLAAPAECASSSSTSMSSSRSGATSCHSTELWQVLY